MTRSLKTLFTFFTVCMLAIVANLTWIQVFGAARISENPFNKRRLVGEYSIERGEIISSDGQVIAETVDTGEEYRFQRVYPAGPLFANVTGYDSWRYGRSGLEQRHNAVLLGEGPGLTFRELANKLLGTGARGHSLVLTVDSRVQRAAAEALGERKGAVVVLDPRTGAVLAMVTRPTFDPNATVPLPGRETEPLWSSITGDPGKPLLDRSAGGLYPPGSSFKVVTAAAAIDTGVAFPESPFECEGNVEVSGFTFHDFDGRGHGGITLSRALAVSCNVTFVRVGLLLGASSLVRYAELFGFNSEVPFELPVTAAGIQQAGEMDLVALAASAIGQAEVLATPLQMALVAAAIANGGVAMKPYLVREIQDYNGKVLEQYRPAAWRDVMSPRAAATLTDMMVRVVGEGTGAAARISGVRVAGKTGTAETGQPGAAPHAWFICFAPAGDPEVAVAVLVENGGEGGRTAAPIARQVLERALYTR